MIRYAALRPKDVFLHMVRHGLHIQGDGRINYPELLRALYVRAGQGAKALLEAALLQF